MKTKIKISLYVLYSRIEMTEESITLKTNPKPVPNLNKSKKID